MACVFLVPVSANCGFLRKKNGGPWTLKWSGRCWTLLSPQVGFEAAARFAGFAVDNLRSSSSPRAIDASTQESRNGTHRQPRQFVGTPGKNRKGQTAPRGYLGRHSDGAYQSAGSYLHSGRTRRYCCCRKASSTSHRPIRPRHHRTGDELEASNCIERHHVPRL